MSNKIGVCWNCGGKLQWDIFDSCNTCKAQLDKQWFTKQQENYNSVMQSRQNVEIYHAMTSGLSATDYL